MYNTVYRDGYVARFINELELVILVLALFPFSTLAGLLLILLLLLLPMILLLMFVLRLAN